MSRLVEITARGISNSRAKDRKIAELSYWKDHFVRKECREDAKAALSALEQAGYVVVPKEPTIDMCECGPCLPETTDGRCPPITATQADETYRAMLDVAGHALRARAGVSA